jgi:hypothetical protein
MQTIVELTQIVNEGESAQDSLNSIAESIYDFYMAEIERQKKELEIQYPWFDEQISELERCNSGFHKYRFSGNDLMLIGRDYFRGETNTEYDSLPIGVFIDDQDKRHQLIKDFVSSKFNAIHARMKKKQEQENEQERQQYEALKEKFETK